MSCVLSVLPQLSNGPRRPHTKSYVIYSWHVGSSVGCVGLRGVASLICAYVLFSNGTCHLFREVISADRFCMFTLLACRYQICWNQRVSKCYLWMVFRYSCLCHATLSVPVESICCHTKTRPAGVVIGA